MADETGSSGTASEGGPTESSVGEGLLHMAEGALETTNDFVEETAKEGAHAFEAAGATAKEAAELMETPAAKDIPIVSNVISGTEVIGHAGTGIWDAVKGDWDGAADHALSMADSAIGTVFGATAGLAEGAFDLGNAAAGGGESTDLHHQLLDGLHKAGDWLGDEAYKLVHGDDSGSSAARSSAPAGDSGSSAGGDAGGPAGGDSGSPPGGSTGSSGGGETSPHESQADPYGDAGSYGDVPGAS